MGRLKKNTTTTTACTYFERDREEKRGEMREERHATGPCIVDFKPYNITDRTISHVHMVTNCLPDLPLNIPQVSVHTRILIRPLARTSRREVTWMSKLYVYMLS